MTVALFDSLVPEEVKTAEKQGPYRLCVQMGADVRRALVAAARKEERSWSGLIMRYAREGLIRDGYLSQPDG